jgi:glycosyltransferase involved in cell wall biosynthesis
MNNPKVSVLLPVFNAAKYLNECIDSILNQTFFDFEFIIINDGSTDSSKEIILSYKDQRIKYYENEQNIKLIATLNKGLKFCTGKYIARIDADDVALPQRLEKQYTYMESNPDIGVCGSWLYMFGDVNTLIKFKTFHDEIRLELYFRNHMHHPTMMIRNSVLLENEILFPNVLHSEDYAFLVLLSDYTKFHIIPEVLLKYRVHGSSICAQNTDIQNQQATFLRKSQYEKLGLNCENELFINFNKWLISERIDNKRQAKNIIILLCDLYQSIYEKTDLNKELLKDFFSKKAWALICEFPQIKSYYRILRHNLIDKDATLLDKLKLLLNCLIKVNNFKIKDLFASYRH